MKHTYRRSESRPHVLSRQWDKKDAKAHFLCARNVGCVSVNDMCAGSVSKTARQKASGLHCGYCGARFSNCDEGYLLLLQPAMWAG